MSYFASFKPECDSQMNEPIIIKESIDFIEILMNFKEFGSETQIETVSDVTYYVNEFWTSKQRQGARIHEVSYRACFKPQLPLFFIDRCLIKGCYL